MHTELAADTSPSGAAGTIHVLQPALPTYRHDFFERLAQAFPGRFFVHASLKDLGALTSDHTRFPWERRLGPIRQLVPGTTWQVGAVGLPLRRGDVLVLSGAPRTLSNIVLMVRARIIGATVIWWGHYLSPNSPFWRQALKSLLMRAAHGLLFYTDAEVVAYRHTAFGRRDKRPVSALNNGLNVDPISRLRQPYIAAERPKDLLFIGRLTEKAQIALAIEALSDNGLGDVRLQIIGDGESAASARQLAHQLGVSDRVIWNGALTDEAQIAAIANECRLFVYPGAVGLSLIHGLAYGLPVVVHGDVATHMPEIAAFQSGVNGISFQDGSAHDLADAIRRLLCDLSCLERLSDDAMRTVTMAYNTENMTVRFVELVNNISKAP